MVDVRDFAEDRLADLLHSKLLGAAELRVRSELGTIVRRAFLEARVEPNSPGSASCPALRSAIGLVENRLRSWAQGLSSLHWLWLLRRLPEEIFAGQLRSTSGYDQTLAEVISSGSCRLGTPTIDENGIVSYALDERIAEQLARLAEGIRFLSALHVEYRWAAKGARLTLRRDNRLECATDAALRAAVALYDGRRNQMRQAHGRAGTMLLAADDDIPNAIMTVRGVSGFWGNYDGTIPEVAERARIYVRYAPDPSWHPRNRYTRWRTQMARR